MRKLFSFKTAKSVPVGKSGLLPGFGRGISLISDSQRPADDGYVDGAVARARALRHTICILFESKSALWPILSLKF